ncbi:hypothetical protein OIU84_024906 [Salix udensis]|uniref:GPI inositol-deacylase n=1 Tax=Salix udensis TaxID=889485 RepID=A0AAD6KIB6_9ROSI|nr:hypothetical protein OIU84_024906 [Salix udensis]
MTVLAMDGRRRWLDIHKLGSDGKGHFMFVTNLAPCSGIRLHLWPDKGKSASEMAASKRVLEVTAKLVQIPSGPAPRQIEPGSQTEQAPPSAVLWLSPEDMHGFRFLTVSVAPRPTISGRPPPAASMAVGQFFNPDDGKRDLSAQFMLLSTHSQKELLLKEDHPLALNLSFTKRLETWKTVGFVNCGVFPPIVLAWDHTAGLHILPNLFSETIMVDSSPALWSSTQGSEKTTIMLLVDPHCSYKARIAVSETSAASRFLLLYSSQIVGFSFAAIFFALMRQAHAWDLDLPMPSMLVAVESNLRIPWPFLLLGFVPILFSLFISLLKSQPLPPLASFAFVSTICYVFANGSVILLVLVSQLVFYGVAIIHVFIKSRWQECEGNICLTFLHWFINLSSGFFSLRVVRVLRVNPLLVTALAAITLGCIVHPALGLFILILSHALCCHNALCSFFTASFRSNARMKELLDFKDVGNERSQQFASKHDAGLNQNIQLEENSSSSPDSSRSFGDTQLETFHHRHGLLILHLLATLMFVPSFVAWLQRIGMGHSLPWFLDSALCIGVILHGILNSKPEFISMFSFPEICGKEVRLDFIYLLAGYYSYVAGLGLVPYRVFYAMAAIGFISCALRILYRRSREKGEPRFGRKKRSHRH